VKRCGGKIWMGLTRKSISLRAYTTFGEVRDMIARTAFTQLGYSPWLLLGTLVGMLLTYIVPVVLALQSRPPVWQIALGAWVLMTLTYLPTVRFYRLSPLWATFLPQCTKTWVQSVHRAVTIALAAITILQEDSQESEKPECFHQECICCVPLLGL
jgi:hypothetical protein